MKDNNKLKIIPLGGLGLIGMNMTAFQYNNCIVVVDCGLSFPEDDMLGVDLVIPDFSYLTDNADKVKGFVITHGHEDHIGALTYAMNELNVPIYGTRLTIGIIERKFKEKDLLECTERHVVRFTEVIQFGDISVEFIRTNHSIPGSAALAIRCPVGTVVHTGDFKVDYTPVYGDTIDLQRFAELGREGVLALLSDSTNAERPGFTWTEKSVGNTIERIFSEHLNQRIIIATFASNVDRMQQIINVAFRYNRKVAVDGRSMVNIIETASELGYLDIPENTLIETSEMRNYPDDHVCIISTGSQGESMAALSRMAAGIHKKIFIRPNDTIILSSNPIPGNEKAVNKIINELLELGAQVIFQDVHVSGHARQEELKLMYALTQPKYAIPLHGEMRHLKANAEIARTLGIPEDHIFILQAGDVLELTRDGVFMGCPVHTGAILVDGLGVGDVGSVVLRDRQKLSEDGVFIVAMSIDEITGEILAGPDIVSRGFVYVRESEDLLEEARMLLTNKALECLCENGRDRNRLKNVMKDVVSEFLWTRTKRRPMVIPVIMEV